MPIYAYDDSFVEISRDVVPAVEYDGKKKIIEKNLFTEM